MILIPIIVYISFLRILMISLILSLCWRYTKTSSLMHTNKRIQCLLILKRVVIKWLKSLYSKNFIWVPRNAIRGWIVSRIDIISTTYLGINKFHLGIENCNMGMHYCQIAFIPIMTSRSNILAVEINTVTYDIVWKFPIMTSKVSRRIVILCWLWGWGMNKLRNHMQYEEVGCWVT